MTTTNLLESYIYSQFEERQSNNLLVQTYSSNRSKDFKKWMEQVLKSDKLLPENMTLSSEQLKMLVKHIQFKSKISVQEWVEKTFQYCDELKGTPSNVAEVTSFLFNNQFFKVIDSNIENIKIKTDMDKIELSEILCLNEVKQEMEQ